MTAPRILPVETEVGYWISPVKSYPEETAEECIETLVGQERVFAFSDRVHRRTGVKPADWVCFYAAKKGVVGHARVASEPRRESHPKIIHPGVFPWLFDVDSERLYLDDPTVIDAALRGRMDEFREKGTARNWGWLVHTTRAITEHDFRILTRQEAGS